MLDSGSSDEMADLCYPLRVESAHAVSPKFPTPLPPSHLPPFPPQFGKSNFFGMDTIDPCGRSSHDVTFNALSWIVAIWLQALLMSSGP